jgi:hypothetical protein
MWWGGVGGGGGSKPQCFCMDALQVSSNQLKTWPSLQSGQGAWLERGTRSGGWVTQPQEVLPNGGGPCRDAGYGPVRASKQDSNRAGRTGREGWSLPGASTAACCPQTSVSATQVLAAGPAGLPTFLCRCICCCCTRLKGVCNRLEESGEPTCTKVLSEESLKVLDTQMSCHSQAWGLLSGPVGPGSWYPSMHRLENHSQSGLGYRVLQCHAMTRGRRCLSPGLLLQKAGKGKPLFSAGWVSPVGEQAPPARGQ